MSVYTVVVIIVVADMDVKGNFGKGRADKDALISCPKLSYRSDTQNHKVIKLENGIAKCKITNNTLRVNHSY